MADRNKGVFVDLLDGTFNLISRTWMTSLILGGVLFIPAAFLYGWAFGQLMDAFKNMGGMAEDPTSLLATLGLAYAWIFAAALVQGLLSLFVRACVTEHSARVIRGEPANTFSIALHVIRQRYLPLLGQRVLQLIILSITFLAAVLITGVVVGVLVSINLTWLAVLLGCILGLSGTGVVIWLAVRYTVTLEAMVIDDAGIDHSFDLSMVLVKHRWWRVLGYTLLFGLMVSFAASIIGTPIVFFSTIRPFMRMLGEMLKESSTPQSFNSVLFQLMSGFGRRLGILEYIQGLIVSFVTPVFMTLLFFHLKKPREPEPQPQTVAGSSPEAQALPPGTGA